MDELAEFERELKASLEKQDDPITPEQQMVRIPKDTIISFVSDSAGCGHIRNIFPLTFFNSVFAKDGVTSLISHTFIWQHDILARSRAIFFQRQMNPGHLQVIRKYKEMQSNFKYKMIWEIDDFIWSRNENQGGSKEDGVPVYNFGHLSIDQATIDSSIEIIKLMDIVTVSTEYLRDYIRDVIGFKNVVVVPNTVPKYLYGNTKKKPIQSKIVKPRVIYTGSPTHYRNPIPKLLPGQSPQFPNGFEGMDGHLGDFENSWKEFILKNVKDNKIDFFCMGGTPWFFEEIKNRSNVTMVDWVTSLEYANTVKNIRADAGIMPLVPNQFNRSKSSIKAKEYFVLGILALAPVLPDYSGPYEFCPWKTKWDESLENIDKKFWDSMEPEVYNSLIKKQYDLAKEHSFYTEDANYVNHFMGILSNPNYNEDWKYYNR